MFKDTKNFIETENLRKKVLENTTQARKIQHPLIKKLVSPLSKKKKTKLSILSASTEIFTKNERDHITRNIF